MPICTIHTNLPDEKVPDEFVKEFSQLIADTLPEKTIDVVTVHLHTNARVFRAGTTDPVVSIGLVSFNVFSPEKNPEYANKLLEYIHEHLNVPYSRITLQFMPIEQWHIGLKT